MPLDCSFKKGYLYGKVYVMYILPQLKKNKANLGIKKKTTYGTLEN